jgi:hypothetical protein
MIFDIHGRMLQEFRRPKKDTRFGIIYDYFYKGKKMDYVFGSCLTIENF